MSIKFVALLLASVALVQSVYIAEELVCDVQDYSFGCAIVEKTEVEDADPEVNVVVQIRSIGLQQKNDDGNFIVKVSLNEAGEDGEFPECALSNVVHEVVAEPGCLEENLAQQGLYTITIPTTWAASADSSNYQLAIESTPVNVDLEPMLICGTFSDVEDGVCEPQEKSVFLSPPE